MRIVFNPFTAKFDYVLAPAEILAGLLAIDGAGSGLDADLLDSNHAAAFVAVIGDIMTGDLRGMDFVATRTVALARDGSGYISTVTKTGGRTVTITRDVNHYITSITDTINTWTFTRDVDNKVTDITVT